MVFAEAGSDDARRHLARSTGLEGLAAPFKPSDDGTALHYIKDVAENTLQAMNQLERLLNDCSTVKH